MGLGHIEAVRAATRDDAGRTTHASTFDRTAAIERYRRNRTHTRALLDLLDEEAYYSRPIALRHPFVFYEGHLPAFSFNTLCKRALGESGIDSRLETLFARGIDPDESRTAEVIETNPWPSRDAVRQFADEAEMEEEEEPVSSLD